MPKSTVRLGKCKVGVRAKGNQMSTIDKCMRWYVTSYYYIVLIEEGYESGEWWHSIEVG
jgi:hypothetical protein